MPTDKKLTKTLLEMYHLLHRYHQMWYGKNFGGMDPWQGQGRILSALRRMHSINQKELGFIFNSEHDEAWMTPNPQLVKQMFMKIKK